MRLGEPHQIHYMYRARDHLDHSKGLATPSRMDKFGPVWVHTHWSSTSINSHACVVVLSTKMQAHSNKANSQKYFLQTKTEFQEDKLDH